MLYPHRRTHEKYQTMPTTFSFPLMKHLLSGAMSLGYARAQSSYFVRVLVNFTVFQLLEFAHIHFSQQLSALGKTIDKVFKYDSFKEIRSKPFITKFQTKFFLLIYFSSSFVYKTRSFIILVFTCISVYSILIYLNINTSTVLCLFFRYHIYFFVIACSRMKRQIKETLDVEQFLLF